MTREEAIWWVNHLFEIRKEEYWNKGAVEDAKEVETAQNMAISALSAEPYNKDAISRQGLLESWNELSPRGRTEFDQVIMTIPALPSALSAEPKDILKSIPTVELLAELGVASVEELMEEPLSHEEEWAEIESDLISRADAIEKVSKQKDYIKSMIDDVEENDTDFMHGVIRGCQYAICLIKETSSADRPMGEWQHKPSKSGEWIWWKCSKCGAVIYSESEADRKIHHAYCGVCGARMEKGENE